MNVRSAWATQWVPDSLGYRMRPHLVTQTMMMTGKERRLSMETIVTCRHGAGGASPPPSTGEAERGGS